MLDSKLITPSAEASKNFILIDPRSVIDSGINSRKQALRQALTAVLNDDSNDSGLLVSVNFEIERMRDELRFVAWWVADSDQNPDDLNNRRVIYETIRIELDFLDEMNTAVMQKRLTYDQLKTHPRFRETVQHLYRLYTYLEGWKSAKSVFLEKRVDIFDRAPDFDPEWFTLEQIITATELLHLRFGEYISAHFIGEEKEEKQRLIGRVFTILFTQGIEQYSRDYSAVHDIEKIFSLSWLKAKLGIEDFRKLCVFIQDNHELLFDILGKAQIFDDADQFLGKRAQILKNGEMKCLLPNLMNIGLLNSWQRAILSMQSGDGRQEMQELEEFYGELPKALRYDIGSLSLQIELSQLCADIKNVEDQKLFKEAYTLLKFPFFLVKKDFFCFPWKRFLQKLREVRHDDEIQSVFYFDILSKVLKKVEKLMIISQKPHEDLLIFPSFYYMFKELVLGPFRILQGIDIFSWYHEHLTNKNKEYINSIHLQYDLLNGLNHMDRFTELGGSSDDYLKFGLQGALIEAPSCLTLARLNEQYIKYIRSEGLYGKSYKDYPSLKEQDWFREVSENFSGWYLRGANLEKLNLERVSFAGADVMTCRMKGSNLRFADLSHANLKSACLSEAILANANLQYTNCTNADFSQAKLWSADMRDADLTGAILTNSEVKSAKMRNTIFKSANLENADLSECSADLSNFEGANLTNADLHELSGVKAVFTNANCTKTNFRKAQLAESSFKGALLFLSDFEKANLQVADLSEARIVGSSFTIANLRNASLNNAKANSFPVFGSWSRYVVSFVYADLEGADIRKMQIAPNIAYFNHANLKSASFKGSSMRQSQFISAQAEGADFSFTDLSQTDWESADIKNADFTDADLKNAKMGLVQNIETVNLNSAKNSDTIDFSGPSGAS